MATNITLTVPQNLTEQEQHDVRSLLKDALHEFTTMRHPAASYVADRYVGVLSPAEALATIAQVDRRVALGRLLFNAAFDARVDTAPAETPPPVAEKLRLFGLVLAHEAAHHVHGNPPDMESLTRLLAEVFA